MLSPHSGVPSPHSGVLSPHSGVLSPLSVAVLATEVENVARDGLVSCSRGRRSSTSLARRLRQTTIAETLSST